MLIPSFKVMPTLSHSFKDVWLFKRVVLALLYLGPVWSSDTRSAMKRTILLDRYWGVCNPSTQHRVSVGRDLAVFTTHLCGVNVSDDVVGGMFYDAILQHIRMHDPTCQVPPPLAGLSLEAVVASSNRSDTQTAWRLLGATSVALAINQSTFLFSDLLGILNHTACYTQLQQLVRDVIQSFYSPQSSEALKTLYEYACPLWPILLVSAVSTVTNRNQSSAVITPTPMPWNDTDDKVKKTALITLGILGVLGMLVCFIRLIDNRVQENRVATDFLDIDARIVIMNDDHDG